MYAMTIDQRGSRKNGDAVPRLLDDLGSVPTVRGFTRTVGDEVQGILDDAAAVAQVVRLTSTNGGWHIGIGLGAVEEPLPDAIVEARGEAFYAARRAVEAAKSAPAHLVVDRHGHGAQGAEEHLVLAQDSLRLMARVIENIRIESRRYIDFSLAHPSATQKDIAAHFGVSQQAVSRVLSHGSVEIIGGGQELSAFHLEKAGTHVV